MDPSLTVQPGHQQAPVGGHRHLHQLGEVPGDSSVAQLTPRHPQHVTNSAQWPSRGDHYHYLSSLNIYCRNKPSFSNFY